MKTKVLPWFRMYAEAVDDEKLCLLAFEDRWHFVAILCLKRKGVLDAGDPTEMLDRKVGLKLRLAASERDEVRRRLMEVGIIDIKWQPIAWDRRQFQSDADPTAGERKKRQREKQRHSQVTHKSPVTRKTRSLVRHGSVTDHVTRDNRDSHVRVTDGSRMGHEKVTPLDTEKNEEEESESSQGKKGS